MKDVDKTEKLRTVAAFVHELINVMNAGQCLKITISNFAVFEDVSTPQQNATGFEWENDIDNTKKFDFILGDFPLGLKQKEYEFEDKKLKIRQNWIEIIRSLKFLNKDGAALYLVEPTCFVGIEGEKFEAALNSGGYFVNAIFNAPEGILCPETSIIPVFALITRNKTNTIYLAELLDESQSREVARNFCSEDTVGDLVRGMMIERGTFHGFHRVKIKQQIEKLETQYKEYEGYSIKEIALEINYVANGKSLEEKENSVYMPKFGNLAVETRLSDTTIKHHNYFQVVLGDKAINEYVAAFFKSDLGRLVLQSLTSGYIIQHLNKRDLEQAIIALPSIDDQEQILTTQRKLIELKIAIDNFDSELALNPISSNSILDQLDCMLDVIGVLTEADEIRSLIRQGESQHIEFKETLSLNVENKAKDKRLELSVLKTIVAFLNSKGGVLLVGVSDDGKIPGVATEIRKLHKSSTDKYLLYFKNLLKVKIGEQFYPYIDYKLVKFDGVIVLMVKCNKSMSPCYLDNVEFYVRTNPATDKLEGPKLVQYIKNHFG